jgi:hypothetical protein
MKFELFLRVQVDIQPSYELHQAQMLTLVEPTMQKHDVIV